MIEHGEITRRLPVPVNACPLIDGTKIVRHTVGLRDLRFQDGARPPLTRFRRHPCGGDAVSSLLRQNRRLSKFVPQCLQDFRHIVNELTCQVQDLGFGIREICDLGFEIGTVFNWLSSQ